MMIKKIFLAAMIAIALALPLNAQDGFIINPFQFGGGGSSDSYDTGNIFSERFGTTGSDGYDNTPDGTYDEGSPTVSADDQTSLSSTGFEGDHFSMAGSANWVVQRRIDLASAQSTVYGRFFVYIDSNSWANSTEEDVVTLTDSIGTQGSTDEMVFTVGKDASGNLVLRCKMVGEAGWSTGGGESGTLSLDTSYKVEFQYSDTTVTWWIDNSQIGQRTGLSSTTDIQRLHYGLGYNSAAAVVRLDTIDLDSSGRLSDS